MANSRKARVAEAPASALAAIAEQELRPHVGSGERVTVALSGGIDSIVLLDVMRRIASKLNIELGALHVHHGLSPNADTWEGHCRAHCARRRIPFLSVRVDVCGGGANLEEEARRARYRAFEQHGTRVIVLAHNLDDQAETVLFRLLRGAGVHGLGGMRKVRPLGPPAECAPASARLIIRPLLSVTRRQIEAYARSKRLRWVEDESNVDSRHARNFLRNEILPSLERRFPGTCLNVVRAATHLAQADELLRAVAREDLLRASVDEGLDVDVLRTLGSARTVQVLRLALEARGEPPMSTEFTHEMLRQLFEARVDRAPSLSLERHIVRRYRRAIVIEPRPDLMAMWSALAWLAEAEQSLPDGTSVCARLVEGRGVSRDRLAADRVTLRRRLGGESIRLRPGASRRTLKNLLREHAVPPWQRDRMPLLFCGEQLVWVPRVGVASEFLASPTELGWEFEWRMPPI